MESNWNSLALNLVGDLIYIYMDGASSSTMNEFTCTPWISSHRPSIPTLQYIYNYIRIYIFYDTLWDYCGAFETTKSIKSTWLGDLFTIVYHMIHFGFQTWCISFMQHNLYFKKIKISLNRKLVSPPLIFHCHALFILQLLDHGH